MATTPKKTTPKPSKKDSKPTIDDRIKAAVAAGIKDATPLKDAEPAHIAQDPKPEPPAKRFDVRWPYAAAAAAVLLLAVFIYTNPVQKQSDTLAGAPPPVTNVPAPAKAPAAAPVPAKDAAESEKKGKGPYIVTGGLLPNASVQTQAAKQGWHLQQAVPGVGDCAWGATRCENKWVRN